MANQAKYEKILDALQTLLEDRSIQTISVSEIAQTAGIGKAVSTITFRPKMRSWMH